MKTRSIEPLVIGACLILLAGTALAGTTGTATPVQHHRQGTYSKSDHPSHHTVFESGELSSPQRRGRAPHCMKVISHAPALWAIYLQEFSPL